MTKQQQVHHSSSRSPYQAFIRYSNIVFFVVISSLLALATGLLLLAISDSHNPSATGSDVINTTFDQDTIDKLKKLSETAHTGVPPLPSGRTNPFE